MDNTNSTLLKAQEILWHSAIVKSHAKEKYGLTPKDSGLKKEDVKHIDIGVEQGRLMIKAFYISERTCFYLDIPESHWDHWIQAQKELLNFNPFEEPLRTTDGSEDKSGSKTRNGSDGSENKDGW